jgi:zinc protease
MNTKEIVMRTKAIFALLILPLVSVFPQTQEIWVNGLKVLLTPNPANEIVSAQLYLRGGALNIDETTQGIEPLIFNTAVKGSKGYAKEKIDAILDRTGAAINNLSTRDFSVITLRCLTSNFSETFDLFADIAINPTLAADELELERKKQILAVKQRKDDADGAVRELADEMYYRGHQYKLNPSGTESSLQAITVDQMRAHWSKHFVTSKLLLIVVGNIPKSLLQERVEKAFASVPRGDYKPSLPTAISHSAATVQVTERQLPTNYIIGYFGAPRLGNPDHPAAIVALDILRNRVWEEVRTKRNLSYAPSAFLDNSLVSRAAIYVTAVQPDTTVKVMLAELQKMQAEPVTDKDLRDRVTMFITRYYLNNETNDAQGRFLAYPEIAGVGWREAQKFVDNIRSVTAKQVQEVAKKYFGRIQFAIVGNPALIDQKVFTSM